MYITLGVQALIAVFIISLRDYLGWVFSNDDDVVDLVAKIAPIAAYFEVRACEEREARREYHGDPSIAPF